MKITFSPAVGRTGWGSEVTLCAGQDQSPENIQVNGTSVVDMVPTLSGTVYPLDRKNVSTNLSFQVTNQKASFDLSEQDLLFYFTYTIPQYGLFRFYTEASLSGPPYAFMIGTITGFGHSEIGITTVRAFTISGGAIVNTLPPHAP